MLQMELKRQRRARYAALDEASIEHSEQLRFS